MFERSDMNVLPSPSKEQIIKTERFYRISLPEDYVEFIKNYNGAIPKKNAFTIDGREYLVERFLCILGNLKNDYEEGWADIGVIITQIFDRLTDSPDELGMKIIPIAALFAGDFVCLDFRVNKKDPNVCIWYHETSDEFKPDTKKVARNFTDFLEMLK
ncbi:SUKH superfamily protein [Breznakia blatticola]|uniref:SUKH superfamily protein n=1 Tax=Breznakia blatticola TaxID=1754012 RepID=A0A4R7ZGF6_9FIRM|nr:SMI1/KNR4 family protein [Breznakia blatticola]TDW16245.1 SUKH superfamily protein [Breznakia blatticola]